MLTRRELCLVIGIQPPTDHDTCIGHSHSYPTCHAIIHERRRHEAVLELKRICIVFNREGHTTLLRARLEKLAKLLYCRDHCRGRGNQAFRQSRIWMWKSRVHRSSNSNDGSSWGEGLQSFQQYESAPVMTSYEAYPDVETPSSPDSGYYSADDTQQNFNMVMPAGYHSSVALASPTLSTASYTTSSHSATLTSTPSTNSTPSSSASALSIQSLCFHANPFSSLSSPPLSPFPNSATTVADDTPKCAVCQNEIIHIATEAIQGDFWDCRRCRQVIHSDCFNKYVAHRREKWPVRVVKCPYCRYVL